MRNTKRTNMKPDERRAQLIAVAQTLFFEKGFEDTTMADIIAAANVSKGGFYHHFKSKDALFYGLLDFLITEIERALIAIASHTTRPALDRLVDVIATEGVFLSQASLAPQMQIVELMHAERNFGMSARFERMARAMITPILETLIIEGQADGSMHVSEPGAAADLISYLLRAFDLAQVTALRARGTPEAGTQARHLRSVMTQQFLAIDRILGVSPGTTSYGWPGFVDALMALPTKHHGKPSSEASAC